MSDEVLNLSAKTLGGVALPNFCPRCFWSCMRLRKKIPYSNFPSIFGKIDAFTKKVMHGFIDREGRPPKCLGELGNVIGYIEPPTHQKFRTLTDHNIMLCGTPDAVFELDSGTLAIVDYKTAQPLGEDDPLFPMYLVQLNGYALLSKETGLGTVSKLALLYETPQTSWDDAATSFKSTEDGFDMSFHFQLHEVKLDLPALDAVLELARTTYDQPKRPDGRPGCRDCAAVDQWYDFLADCNDGVQAFAKLFRAA